MGHQVGVRTRDSLMILLQWHFTKGSDWKRLKAAERRPCLAGRGDGEAQAGWLGRGHSRFGLLWWLEQSRTCWRQGLSCALCLVPPE